MQPTHAAYTCRIHIQHTHRPTPPTPLPQEHYPAIVLAVHGLANETNCDSKGHTFVDWTMMTTDGRPRSYRRREIHDELVMHARLADNTMEEVEVCVLCCWCVLCACVVCCFSCKVYLAPVHPLCT